MKISRHGSQSKRAVPHHDAEVAELRADRELAIIYLKEALEAFSNPEERAGAFLALCAISEATDGFAAIAADAGIMRD
jgi:DNA-binding phage protein